MAAVETILETIFKIFESGDLQVTVDSRNLGMAYAIPKDSEQSVVQDFGPWTPCEVKQVFFRQGALGAPMVEVQLILSWRVSAARQYIVEAFLDKNVITLDPTVKLAIAIRFNQPELFDADLEAFSIPFQVEVTFKPLGGIGGTETRISKGAIRADGTGTFPAFD
jgi:hypothetical protein